MGKQSMKKLFTDNWRFLKTLPDTDYDTVMKHRGDFADVLIPHDWMIDNPRSFYEDGNGWYLNSFEAVEGRRYTFIFDGIYMDSIVYINGREADEWKSGYTQFVLDVSHLVSPGVNEICVAVRCRYPSARWYTGAGIYRNVWLCEYDDVYIPENGIYTHAVKSGRDYLLHVTAEVTGNDGGKYKISCELSDRNGERVQIVSLERHGDTDITLTVKEPQEWSIEEPVLYDLAISLLDDSGAVMQTETVRTGFRDIKLDPDEGLYLNDEHLKLNGVCIHHDLGALGVAFNRCAFKRRLKQIKAMGANALRLAHNAFDPAVLELADEMGFLVISESFDMWERPKTEYDFSRFFSEWYKRDVASWVKRDRNHPCVFMWSIGNEIYDTHADERGLEITKLLRDEVRRYDPEINAYVTIASDYMPWKNAQRCAEELDAVGYNYAERCYEQHHREHPDWVIYGSETYSLVQSRGIYHFPLAETIISDSDLQCSSLGNSNTSWGAKSLEYCICTDRDLKFSLGQFIWTGYDYIGEPTPYHTKNSYFGLIDTAGFFKDAYYVWKSAWVKMKEDPFVHIFPYWDFNEGQRIDVRVASNAPFVELFLNGKSLGKQKLDHEEGSGQHIIADYSVIFERGVLEARAYDENGEAVAADVKRSFGETCGLELNTDETSDADDLVFTSITAIDENGFVVENANDHVKVTVKNGTLIGFDNGDSSDYDSYKSDTRRLFSGRALVIVKKAYEDILPRIEAEPVPSNDIRAIRLTSENVRELSPDNRTVTVKASVLPQGADDSGLIFRVLNNKGVKTNIAKVEGEGAKAVVTALGDGEFRVRCEADNGADHARVISELEFSAQGLGTAFLDPYGYIYAGLYSGSEGEVSAGNEQGIATGRDGITVVTYEGIDFGVDGSDKITVDIFALSDEPYDIEIWRGVPGTETAQLLGSRVYRKKMIWNVYQPETWELDRRLAGVNTISLRVRDKIHIKGFSFEKQNRAWHIISASDAGSIYGDRFTKKDDLVEDIGNNVTLSFGEMDFSPGKASGIMLYGRAKGGTNTIHLHLKSSVDGTEVTEILEFSESVDLKEMDFPISPRSGRWSASFIFLPGSNFDFGWFRFV